METRIIELYAQHMLQEDIAAYLHTGIHRVSRTIKIFQETGSIPSALPRGPPRRLSNQIIDYVELQTLQDARLSGPALSRDVGNRFNAQFCSRTINRIRSRLKFRYQPPRHTQALTEIQIQDRLAFCRKMLDMRPESLDKIYFSNESRIVLGSDKQWVW
jgi:transposase